MILVVSGGADGGVTRLSFPSSFDLMKLQDNTYALYLGQGHKLELTPEELGRIERVLAARQRPCNPAGCDWCGTSGPCERH